MRKFKVAQIPLQQGCKVKLLALQIKAVYSMWWLKLTSTLYFTAFLPWWVVFSNGVEYHYLFSRLVEVLDVVKGDQIG